MIGNQQAEDLRRCCDALEAERDRLREALQEAVRVLESARLLCNWPAMNAAIDAAAKQGRAALSGESNGG